MKTSEVNFDGLIGPTHNFAGLSHGNLASMGNKGRVSNPRNAALQGLRKMRRLHELGLKQALLPPLYRPDFDTLKRLGFSGSKERMLHQLAAQPIELIAAFFSASSMWTANAATVSPSADTADGRVHLTPANLTSKLHRSLEP
ncbi:MAG: N-succinylarginine dihydrolase, partial [Deltaproteobacteria bacterium]|nr:N-succinylarginine dihydrolase [Deltaproteobacteria bacterium]